MSNKTMVRFGKICGICVDEIVFWEMRQENVLDVYVSGLPNPFVLGGDEAQQLLNVLSARSLDIAPVQENNND